jgi:hypothetical protein
MYVSKKSLLYVATLDIHDVVNMFLPRTIWIIVL